MSWWKKPGTWWERQDVPAPWEREAWDELVCDMLGIDVAERHTEENLMLVIRTGLAMMRDCEMTHKEETVATATRYMMEPC